MNRALPAMLLALAAACGPHLSNGLSLGDGSPVDSGAGVPGADGRSIVPTCSGVNVVGCGCSTVGVTHACYTGPAGTDGIGACKEGTSTCAMNGELDDWGPCSGQVTPAAEVCNDGIDNDCNGLVDCADPSCASTSGCSGVSCTPGESRPCYTGPAGTVGVGLCKAGTQACQSGDVWTTACTGETLPAPENCTNGLDDDCNGKTDCADPACASTPACMAGTCTTTVVIVGVPITWTPDPGCSCGSGSGDATLCPAGAVGVQKFVTETSGGSTITTNVLECCPCSASDCSNYGCCASSACAGSSACTGVTCKPLPSTCGGMVSADCDDFPEDCDEPCCPCKPASSGCP